MAENPVGSLTSLAAQRKRSRPPVTLNELGKVPPQALELEQVVLGALMLEKDALSRVIDILTPEVFYKDAHQFIFEAIRNLFQTSEPVDILTVTEQLKKEGQLEMVGGPYYVTELTSRVASAANIEHHARLLTQKYLQRELIKVAGEVQRDAYDDTIDVFDLLDSAEQSLFSLSENSLRRDSLSASELVPQVIKQMEEMKTREDGITGVPSGFRSLDKLTSGWQPSDLIIIAARPAMGKTAFTLSVARNAAIHHNVPVAFFSLEMANTQLAQRLLSAEAELELSKLRTGNLEPWEWEKLNVRSGKLASAPIYINDTPALSIYDLRAKCRRLKAEKGIQLVVIDYLQLMTGASNRSGNREQEIASISRSLKELAKELNVAVIALSQLSRQVEVRGGDKRPMLSDLRESGSIEQDADVVCFLYRPEYYGLEIDEEGNSTQGIAEVIIGKQRNGPVDTVKLQFVNRFARFANLPEDDDAPQTIRPNTQWDDEETTLPPSQTFPSRMNDEDDIEGDFDIDAPPF